MKRSSVMTLLRFAILEERTMLKPYRTIDDVLCSPWAKPGALRTEQMECTDRILRSTKLEDSIYADLRAGDTAMDALEQEAAQKLRTFPALSRDVYQSLYSLFPRKNDEDMLTPTAKKFNSSLLSHVTQLEDYPALKNICEGRDLLSYETATEFTSRLADQLDGLLSDLGGAKGGLHTLEKLENAKVQAEKNLSELLERQARSNAPDETLECAVIAAANFLESKQNQVEAVSRIIDIALLRQGQQTVAVVSVAVQAAKEKAEEIQNIIGAWSDEPGNLSRCSLNAELLNRVRKSQKLLEISKYLGRFREIFAQGKKNAYSYGRGETYSVELGNNLSRTLTSELAMLSAPETLPLFLRKYQNKQLKQYRRREAIMKGMGNIICCLDESGSTEGDAAAWGKAVAMTLLEIASDGDRRFALIHFSSRNRVQTDLFLPGKYTPEDKMNAAETFLNGGTNFETPMTEALRLMEEQGFENADIVFITDGECALSESFTTKLRQQQAERRFKVTGILLDKGTDCMEFSLKSFCQKIYRTSELTRDDIVQGIISDRT
jgi:uncharacterized protein with von Willebrand factor type A (vWA) domain